MKHRLVILGSSLTALAVVRDAHKQGFEVVLLDNQLGLAALSRHVDSIHLISRRQEDVAGTISSFGRGRDDLLIACSDNWIEVIRDNRALLEQAYGQILHPDNAALDSCLQKQAFVVFCRHHGLPTPTTWLVDDEPRPASLKLPVIIRPVTRHHGAPAGVIPKALEIQTEAELEQWLSIFQQHRCPAIVAESLLGRQITQYSVGFARGRHSRQHFVARKTRPLPERCDVGSYVELCPNDSVEAVALRTVEALGYFGVGEVEVLHDEQTGEDFLIEVNARPWMQYALATGAGLELLNTTLDRPVRGTPLRSGRVWLDLATDLYNNFSRSAGAVRHGRIGLGTYLFSMMRVNVYAKFDWRDPVPALPFLAVLWRPKTPHKERVS